MTNVVALNVEYQELAPEFLDLPARTIVDLPVHQILTFITKGVDGSFVEYRATSTDDWRVLETEQQSPLLVGTGPVQVRSDRKARIQVNSKNQISFKTVEGVEIFVAANSLSQQQVQELIDIKNAEAATSTAQAIAIAKEEAKNLGNATGQLITTKVVSPLGETLEARLVRLEAGLTPASSTDASVAIPPVLSGTVGVGNDLTLTASAVSAGSGGASSLDFGSGNTTRRLTTTSLEPLTDSTGWSVGVWWRLSGTPANEVMLGFGTGGAASSFQIRTFGTEVGVQVRDASGANTDSRIVYPAAGDYLVVAQYSDAVASLNLYVIPKGGTVSGPSDATPVAFATVTPAAGWYIGSDGTNWTKRPIGEAFKVDRVLTNGELTSLAAGNPITAILTPRLYWPLRNGPQATEANQGAATGADATLVGSSYATAPVFFGANPYKNLLTLRKTAPDGTISVLLSSKVSVGTTLVYKQDALDEGATIVGTQQPVDSVTQRPGNILPSNVVGPVLAVKPSGGTVSVTPSGSQAAGGVFTANFGTGWTTPNGSNTYRGRWEFNTVPVTDYASDAGALTYGTDINQVGDLEFVVIAKSGVGVDSVPVRSNKITLTGTPIVNATTPAQFANTHLYLEILTDITPAVWNVTGYTVLGYDIRNNGVVVRSRAVQTLPKFTPHAPPHSDGAVLTPVASVFDVSEYISYLGQTYFSAPQAKTLEDIPSTFVATTLIANNSTTSGATTTFTPTTATGGVAPRRAIDISPALPGTFALAEDGSITGVFGGALANTVYTVTWIDNAGATDNTDFNFVIVPAGIAALSDLGAPDTPNVTNGGGVITRNVVVSGKSFDLRTITNPDYPGYRLMRAEDAWNRTGLYPGQDYWMAFAVMIKPGEDIPRVGGSDDDMLVFQTHTPAQGNTNPDISLCFQGQSNSMRFRSANNPFPSNLWAYNWNGTDAGGPVPDTAAETTRYSETLPAAGVLIRIIIHYRPGYTTAQQPRFRAWRALNAAAWPTSPLFDSTGLNTYNSIVGPSYPRIGPYKWSDSTWNSASQAFYTSPLYFGQGADLLEASKLALIGYQN